MSFGRDDWHHPQTFTYNELSKDVDEWWESLGEEEQYHWYLNPSPTFNMWVLGLIEPGQTVEINEYEHTYEIIKQ